MRRSKSHKVRHKHPHAHKHVSAKNSSFRGLDNTRDIDEILGKTKIFQDVLGISREELTTLYEHALDYMYAARFDEAQAAFLFLTKINPYAADFWVGLGACHLQHEEYKQAFDAFIMALTMEPSSFECYSYAIEACIALKNYDQAESLLKQAVAYARRHPSNPQSPIILQHAPRIFEEIAQEKANR